MKAIMISIKSKWCAKIMNGEKTIEVRKSKALARAIQKLIDERGYVEIYVYYNKGSRRFPRCVLNGKVVFKFRCYKVEEIDCIASDNGFAIKRYKTKELSIVDIMEKSCLVFEDLKDYLCYSNGYAIYISNLEIFDKPKELDDFKHYIKRRFCLVGGGIGEDIFLQSLEKAPQNFCYVEVD